VNFATLVSDCRRWGLARSAFLRVMRLLDRHAGFHLYRIFVRPLESSHPPLTGQPGISIRLARREELYKAADDPELELTTEFIAEALKRGDAAFGAFDGEDLVAYTWRTSTVVPHADQLWAKADFPCGYGYKTFTRESHRGRRLAGALSFSADTYGLERGYVGHVGFVEVSNYSSLAVERAKGCRITGYAGYLRWFGRSLPFRSAAARTVGFEFFLKPGKTPTQTPPQRPAMPTPTG
jgi:CRP-like cAMP-binding protein